MNRKLSLLTLSSLLALGTVGCSNGSSPTEPAFDLAEPAVAASSVAGDSSLASVSEESRGRGRGGRGGDDDSNDDNGNASGRRGRGQDDAPGDDRGRRGRRGRGGDDDRPNNQNNPNNNNNNNRPNRVGQEFEAAVADVQGANLILANGTRVIVNGQTQWSNRGDLFNLNQVSRAVAANRPVRAEGRGTRQGSGAILALTLKVEVDD